MSFDWRKLVDVANYLKSKNTEEALRSAISRAYYAAFHIALAFCETHTAFKKTSGANDHRLVPDALKVHNDKNIRRAGRSLIRLKTNRWRADYHDHYLNNLKNDTTISIQLTDDIVGALEDFAIRHAP